MKRIVSTFGILFIAVVYSFSQYNYYQAPENTELSKLLYSQGKTIVKKMWEVGSMKGEEKIITTFYAVNYYDYTSPNNIKKGLRIKIENTNKATEDSKIPFTMLETYIDKDELTQIIISIDNMIKFYKEIEKGKEDVSTVYQTKDNFYFGFKKEGKDQFAITEIRFDKAAIKADFKSIEKSLIEIKGIFDNVMNELYLLDSKEKKGKSSESKEEIIDTDI